MNLSKNAFYVELARALEPEGWRKMPGPIHVSALFAKRHEDLILCLGFDESDLYEDRVTAELTLGEHASLMSFPDVPRARCRVGAHLLPDERTRLLDDEFCRPGVTDAWWTGRTAENVMKIGEAVRLAAPRFVARPGLREEIASSERHRAYANRLRAIAATPHDGGKIPPDEWIEAAAALTTAPPKQRRAVAARWAADAWRVFRILGLGEPG